MRRTVVGVLVAAGALATFAPSASTPKSPPAAATRILNAAAEKTKSNPGPLDAIHDFLAMSPDDAQSLASITGCVCARGYEFEHLIATVPDPEHSGYGHFFDESIASIQSAAINAGWTFDRFWFPWKAAGAADRERDTYEPGLMLFRQQLQAQPKLLIVFLISESPKAGINKMAFTRAVELIRHLSGETAACAPTRHLRIAGPSFSGSIGTLRAALLGTHDLDKVEIVSGSATSATNEYLLRYGASARSKYRSQLPFELSYSTTVENDAVTSEQFLRYVRDHWHNPRVAILAESETAFGDAFVDAFGSGAALVLRFPMEISRIRNAYQQDKHLQQMWSGQQGSASEDDESRMQLSLNLEDPHAGTGAVPSYSADQTAAAEDLVLQNILETLNRQNINLVGIGATQIADAVFLGMMLERHCPNTRPFALTSNVLFLHSLPGASLTGMLSVTNYPLFAQNQLWTSPPASKGTVAALQEFSSTYAQGLYNAVRLLLGGEGTIEYGAPGNGTQGVPPVWLTVAGADGFWPVALLDNGSAERKAFHREAASERRSSLHARQAVKASVARMIPFESPSRLWTIIFASFFLLALLHSSAFFYHNLAQKSGAWMALYWLDPNGERSALKRLNLALATVWLTTIAVLLGTAQFSYAIHNLNRVSWVAAVVAMLPVAALAATLIAIAWPAISIRVYALSGLGVAALLSAGLAWTGNSPLGEDSDLYGLFFIYRSLHPTNGVSPLMPPVLLLLALYAWSMSSLRRLRAHELRRPWLPEIQTPISFGTNVKEIEARIESAMTRLVFDAGTFRASMVVMAVSVAILIYWGDLRTFEQRWYDIAIEILVTFVYSSLLLTAARFLHGWVALRSLLHSLETHPMKNAFNRLQGAYSWLSLWSRGASRQPYTTTLGSLERLRTMAGTTTPAVATMQAGAGATGGFERTYAPTAVDACCPDLHSLFEHLEERTNTLLAVAASHHRVPAVTHRSVQADLTEIGRELEERFLAEPWRVGHAGAPSPTQPLDPAKPDANFRMFLAEEFIALRFVGFIRYVVLQLRTMVEYMAAGFVLGALALKAYPFDPQNAIRTAIIFVFAALSVVIITVFSQMDRNAIMSRLSGTDAGKLDHNFLLRIASYGAIPLATLLTSQFPSIGHFVTQWLKPAVEALR